MIRKTIRNLIHIIRKENSFFLIIFSIIISIIISCGIDYEIRYSQLEFSFTKRLFWFVLIFLSIYFFINLLFYFLSNMKTTHQYYEISRKKYGIIAFSVIWLSCFIIFLNMYPGSLHSDGLGQLTQAIKLDKLENHNPLINTLTLSIFVQLAMRFSSVSTGVAFYTLFQFTAYSLCATYTLLVINKTSIHNWIKWACILFFIYPVNLVYATGMWKDTFFAVIFMANMAYILDLFIEKNELPIKKLIFLAIITCLSSLSRDSGWSALVFEIIAFVFLSYRKGIDKQLRNKCRKIAEFESIGIALAFIIIYLIYPLFNVSVNTTYAGPSLPMQQISRVIYDSAYDEEEIEAIKELGYSQETFIEDIKEKYDPSLVDGVRRCFNSKLFGTEKFWKTWINLGLNHPKAYFYATVDHTISFWWPLSESWLYDSRICENDLGIERTGLLFPNIDIVYEIHSRIREYVRPLKILSNSGFTFLMILLCMCLCNLQGNVTGKVLCIPYLMIYIGLFLFAYGCLFRYTYSAVLGMPLLLGFWGLNIDVYKEGNVNE